jgi:hypothetical protein
MEAETSARWLALHPASGPAAGPNYAHERSHEGCSDTQCRRVSSSAQPETQRVLGPLHDSNVTDSHPP